MIINLLIRLVAVLGLLALVACQSKPTKVIEVSVNVFADNTVLVDTRSAFEYTSFHIQGSVSLNTSDFLILKNPKTKLRVFDSDINQTIERLAHKGITPNKKIILLSNKQNSDENKKWRWLLKNIEVDNVVLMSIDEFNKLYKNRRFGEVNREEPWALKTSEDLQKEFIFKKSKDCFVNWSDKKCL